MGKSVSKNWRLFVDPPRSGAWNMAMDEWCLNQAIQQGVPHVRLYQWEAPTLSLGRNQKVEREINLEECEKLDIPLVRRITGGRAVLHGSDLTYSVTAPISPGQFDQGIMGIYRELSLVFTEFMEELGLRPQVKAYSGRERGELVSAVCFFTPSAYEILIEGKKLVGSAQRLLPKGFLQHGSIPLHPQGALLSRIFKGVSSEEVTSSMTDLETLGVFKAHTMDQIQQKIITAFERIFSTGLERGTLSESEAEEIADLMGGYSTWA